MVVDVHGYPTSTVDLRRTIIIDPKRRFLDESQHKRGVHVDELVVPWPKGAKEAGQE